MRCLSYVSLISAAPRFLTHFLDDVIANQQFVAVHRRLNQNRLVLNVQQRSFCDEWKVGNHKRKVLLCRIKGNIYLSASKLYKPSMKHFSHQTEHLLQSYVSLICVCVCTGLQWKLYPQRPRLMWCGRTGGWRRGSDQTTSSPSSTSTATSFVLGTS